MTTSQSDNGSSTSDGVSNEIVVILVIVIGILLLCCMCTCFVVFHMYRKSRDKEFKSELRFTNNHSKNEKK